MILGAQIYTLRDFCQTEKDFNVSMERVAEMGYKTVQISGVGPIDPKTIRKICDSYDLEIVLTHASQDRIINEVEAVIEEHDILGCDYIGLGSMAGRYRDSRWLERFQADFKEPAQKMADAGKLFMYHNHHFEFAEVNGKLIMEHLMEMFSPEEMGFTLDTYWLQAAGCDVVQWVNKLAGRIPCVHLKDMDIVFVGNDIKTVFAPVGEGNINFPAILEAMKAGGTKYLLVEQDSCLESPFTCLEKSYDYLNGLGYK